MANYHLTMQPISRATGRSATAAAAYRSGTLVTDERTGEVFDYRRKQNVVSSDLFMPAGCPEKTTAQFWNEVEAKHKRNDAVVAREIEASLPHELSASERQRLAHDFAKELADFYQVGVEADIHKPGSEGDNRNQHCHFLMSACAVTPDGLGKKVAELDPIHCQRAKIANPADHWRKRWADLSNERLAENGIAARVDHRSLKAQGIDRVPETHLGPAAVGYERRTGEESDVRVRAREQAAEAAREAAERAEQQKLEIELKAARRGSLKLSLDHKAAEDDLMSAERVELVTAMRAKKEQEAAASTENKAFDEVAAHQVKLKAKIHEASPVTPIDPPVKVVNTQAELDAMQPEISARDIESARVTSEVAQRQAQDDQEQEQGFGPMR